MVGYLIGQQKCGSWHFCCYYKNNYSAEITNSYYDFFKIT